MACQRGLTRQLKFEEYVLVVGARRSHDQFACCSQDLDFFKPIAEELPKYFSFIDIERLKNIHKITKNPIYSKNFKDCLLILVKNFSLQIVSIFCVIDIT